MRYTAVIVAIIVLSIGGPSQAADNCETDCVENMCSTCCPAVKDGVKGECCTLSINKVVESTCCTFDGKVSCK